MTKINHEEYKVLKSLDDDWEWIARDGKGDSGRNLSAYLEKPFKDCDVGEWKYGRGTHPINAQRFQFIQWKDWEPYNIQELIEEYEREEAEVKGSEWLKEETSEILLTSKKDGTNYFYYRDLKEKIYNAIDELETLSEYWIEQKSIDTHVDTLSGEVQVTLRLDDLQNVLVPKQEEVKVPKMWHDAIVQNKEDGHSLRWTLNYIDNLNVNDVDSFARAWIAYPNIEVEEEQKYYIDLEAAAYVAKWDGNDQVDIYTDGISGSEEYEFHLTEQEIKDFDPRFWPFIKPVEELGE